MGQKQQREPALDPKTKEGIKDLLLGFLRLIFFFFLTVAVVDVIAITLHKAGNEPPGASIEAERPPAP